MTDRINECVHVGGRLCLEPDPASAKKESIQDFSVQHAGSPFEAHARTRLQLLPRVDKRLPDVTFQAPYEEALHCAAAGIPPSEQASSHDPCVVHDEQVARGQQRRQIANESVLKHPRISPQHQEPRRPSRRRLLGDQFFGKLEIEVCDPHRSTVSHDAAR
jgi:hypothetical protein